MRESDFSWGAKLGGGTFGAVYVVTRKTDGARFVAKEVNLADEKNRESAMKEVHILERINHPRIVRLLGSYRERGLLVIVMEHCDAGDLRHLLLGRQGELLPEEDVWKYFLQTAMGLQHLHSLRIIHRDVKSQNLFLTKQGGVKIGDFGLSRLIGPKEMFAQSFVGTPYYLSPELCEDGAYSEKTDIWSLGVVLYEVLTCGTRFPFDAHNQAALICAILRAEYRPPPEQYSPALVQKLEACLARDPSQRASAASLLHGVNLRQFGWANRSMAEVVLTEDFGEEEEWSYDRESRFSDGDRNYHLKGARGGSSVDAFLAGAMGDGADSLDPARRRSSAAHFLERVTWPPGRPQDEGRPPPPAAGPPIYLREDSEERTRRASVESTASRCSAAEEFLAGLSDAPSPTRMSSVGSNSSGGGAAALGPSPLTPSRVRTEPSPGSRSRGEPRTRVSSTNLVAEFLRQASLSSLSR